MAWQVSGDYFETCTRDGVCPCPPPQRGWSMKIAAGGKGGLGKTTVAGMPARIIAGRGSQVVAPLVLTSALLGFAPAVRAQTPPAYMDLIIGHATTAPAQVAEETCWL